MIRTLTSQIAAVLFFLPMIALAQSDTSWEIGPWTRLSQEPVIRPTGATFIDPLTGHQVSWEKLHTFNPAAS